MMAIRMRRSSATTLQDVAREAGVATMTASVVLNGARSGTRVSEATRARIQEVAARLRYRPNGVARGLSRLRMDTLGVVSIVDEGEINLYFLEVLQGVLEGSARHGQNTTVFSISDWKADEQKILRFCDGRVDGMIFIGPIFSAEFAQTILHYTPFVALHSNGVMPNTYNLDVDNENGAYQVVRHLLYLGHRRIAHFSGGDLVGAQQRVAGYRRALAEADIPLDDRLVVPGEFTAASGQRRMSAILEDRLIAPLPTALFCANDSIASGCLETLTAHGLRVPEDISVAGFDDLPVSRMTSPALTTLRQPFRAMGRRAVELLLLQIKQDAVAPVEDPAAPPPVPGPHSEIFETKLVVRASVGPPPASAIVAPSS